jgi:hypothetical protein
MDELVQAVENSGPLDCEQLTEIISIVVNVMKQHEDSIAMVKKVLLEDVIGGIAGEARRIKRTSLGETIKTKYPALGRFQGPFKQLFDKDVFEDVLERVYPELEKAGFDETKLGELMDGLVEQMSTRFKGIVPEDDAASSETVVVKTSTPEETDDLKGVSPEIAAVLRANRAEKKGA